MDRERDREREMKESRKRKIEREREQRERERERERKRLRARIRQTDRDRERKRDRESLPIVPFSKFRCRVLDLLTIKASVPLHWCTEAAAASFFTNPSLKLVLADTATTGISALSPHPLVCSKPN